MLKHILTALFPAVVIGSVFYFVDKHREPVGKVIKTFFLGSMSAIVVIILSALGIINLFHSHALNASMNTALFHAAIPEESVKFLFFMGYIYFSKEFDEWYDGLLYGIVIGLGFAFLENIVYFFSFYAQAGDYLVVLRSVLSMPLHALVGGIMGYFLGKSKFRKDIPFRMVYFVPALMMPIIFHAFFNYLLMQYNSIFGAAVLVVIQWIMVISMVRYSQKKIRIARPATAIPKLDVVDDSE